jgi:hypothetical protein
MVVKPESYLRQILRKRFTCIKLITKLTERNLRNHYKEVLM